MQTERRCRPGEGGRRGGPRRGQSLCSVTVASCVGSAGGWLRPGFFFCQTLSAAPPAFLSPTVRSSRRGGRAASPGLVSGAWRWCRLARPRVWRLAARASPPAGAGRNRLCAGRDGGCLRASVIVSSSVAFRRIPTVRGAHGGELSAALSPRESWPRPGRTRNSLAYDLRSDETTR